MKISGHVETGDEVIVMEPFFDCYDFMIKTAGGTPRFIALKPVRCFEKKLYAVVTYSNLCCVFYFLRFVIVENRWSYIRGLGSRLGRTGFNVQQKYQDDHFEHTTQSNWKGTYCII